MAAGAAKSSEHKPAQRAAPTAEPRRSAVTAVPLDTAPSLIQRACACGGSCAACSGNGGDYDRIQTKVVIGAANDPLEHEADRAAAQVMRMPGPQQESTPTLTPLAAAAPVAPPQPAVDDALEPEQEVEPATGEASPARGCRPRMTQMPI
jgi:hypothetical protein